MHCRPLRLGTTFLTHGHYINNSARHKCSKCNNVFTLEHIFIECEHYNLERLHLQARCQALNAPYDINHLTSGDIPAETLADFLRAAEILHKL